MEHVFGRKTNAGEFRDCLADLAKAGFLLSSAMADPIRPEAAYVQSAEAERFYAERGKTVDDIPGLAQALLDMRDAVGLFRVAWTRSRADDLEGATHWFGELAEQFANSDDVETRVVTAAALYLRGFTLSELGYSEQIIKTSAELSRHNEQVKDENDGLMHRFALAPELTFREVMAKSINDTRYAMSLLRQVDRTEQAIEANDGLICRLTEATETDAREELAHAVVLKEIALIRFRRHQQAIEAYDELIRRFSDAPELAIQDLVTGARAAIAATLASPPATLPP